MTEIKAVEMDYLKQAIGTDGMPALSWVIQSDGVCVMQTAYQIQLSDTAKFQNVIYDSQKVISKESSGIKSCKKRRLTFLHSILVSNQSLGKRHFSKRK